MALSCAKDDQENRHMVDLDLMVFRAYVNFKEILGSVQLVNYVVIS